MGSATGRLLGAGKWGPAPEDQRPPPLPTPRPPRTWRQQGQRQANQYLRGDQSESNKALAIVALLLKEGK